MLEAYKRLAANGVIGSMMKVGPDGKPINDPGGELPGTLIPRPFQEFPKAVNRVKSDGSKYQIVVYSKAEELRVLSDTSTEEEPRSPLEKERDGLAEELATERKMNAELAKRLENLAAVVDKMQLDRAAENDAKKTPENLPGTDRKGLGGLGAPTAEQRAVRNLK